MSISKPSALLLALLLATQFSSASANDKLSSDEQTKAAATLELINSKLAKASKFKPELKLNESDDIDLQLSEDEKTLTLTTGLVQQLRDDRDALAGLIAHQHAHRSKKPDANKPPSAGGKLLGMLGSAVGGAIDGKLGASGISQTATELGGQALSEAMAASREKEADEASIGWLLEAGYNPHGAARAQKKLRALGEAGSAPAITQQHPATPERIAYLEALIEDNAKAKGQNPDAKTPLLVAAKASAPAASASATASVSASATSDEPIDGISLSKYAAIKNDIAFSGEGTALAKHGLAPEAFAKVDQQWAARIAQDKAAGLGQRYVTHFLEASQGDFADWGKDVAQVKQTGRLQLGTDPNGVDDWASLHKAQKDAARGGSDAAEQFTKAAKEKGLSLYDFNIVNAWWTQRAKERAAQGDKGLLQRME